MSTVTGLSTPRSLTVALFLAAGSWAWTGTLEAQEIAGSVDTARIHEERIRRADSIRAAMVRPQASPEPGLAQGVAVAVGIVAAPVELVGRGVVNGAGAVLPVMRAVESELGERHMSLELAKIGPQSGPAAILRLGRAEGPFLKAGYSINASRLLGAGLRTGGPDAGLEASFRFVRHAQPIFWGLGPGSRESNAADFRWDRHLYTVDGQLPVGERFALRGGVGFERNQVGGGADPGLPDLLTVSDPPTAPGVGDDHDFVRLEAGLALDRTRWKLIQRRGVGVSVDGAIFLGVDGTPVDFYRLAAEGRGVLPLTTRHALATRLLLETNRTISGGPIPFTHLASLGSVQGLRSYPRDRFRDRDRIGIMSEYRYEIWRDREVSMGAEGIVFLDVGTVKRRLSDLSGGDLRSSYGFGLRVVRSAELQALAYAAFASDGSRVDLRFDWPF